MTDLRPEDERLASRLDQALPPGVSRTPRQTSDPLVNTALLLARLQVPPLSAEADARIQQRVLAAMRTQKARSPWRAATYVRWLAAACLIVAVLTVGILPIAASSLPGDPLYFVKRGLENVELLLATTSESRTLVNLTQAERRLEEQTQLVARGEFDPSLMTSALASMQAAADAAQASADPNLETTLQERSTAVTERFAGLLEAAGEKELPPSNRGGGGVPPVESTDEVDAPPSATPPPSRTPQPSRTPVVQTPLSSTPFAPGRPAMLPLPPGLSTRLAPAAGIISTQVADATATCEHGRSCQSSGLPASTPVPGTNRNDNNSANGNANGNSGGNNSANGNANGNSGGNNSNGNANGNSGNPPNGNANGNVDGSGNANGNAGGNNGQSGDNGGGNDGGSSNGNSGGNSNGSNQGNSSGNGPPPDPGGGNGNSGGNNGNSGNNDSGGGNGNSNGNSNNNDNGNNGNGGDNGNSGNNDNGNNGNGNGNSSNNSNNDNGNNGNSNGNSSNNSNNDNGNNGNGNGNSDDNSSNGNSNGNSGNNSNNGNGNNGNGNGNGNS